MVEHYHQLGDRSIELDPLVIPEGLSQRMATIIASEVDLSAPLLYQTVHRRDGEDSLPLAPKKMIVIAEVGVR